MIEALAMPHLAGSSQALIDPVSGERLPGLKYGLKRVRGKRRDQYVDMVWHHDEFAEIVSLLIEIPQALLGDSSGLSETQHALSVALVQPMVESTAEQPRKLLPLVERERWRMILHPDLLLFPQESEFCFRERIR